MSGTAARRIIRWIGKALLWLIVALLALAVVGAIYQAIARGRAERAHPPPGEVVDVGGHGLHINCMGWGSPTVILESGLGNMSVDWANVQPEAARTTHVCAYDRAGMGWSEKGPEPRDARQISSELHALLTKAGIEGTYQAGSCHRPLAGAARRIPLVGSRSGTPRLTARAARAGRGFRLLIRVQDEPGHGER